ncbi:MAG: hypothetical protein Aurels2KO_51380 [Aureliella sp.]
MADINISNPKGRDAVVALESVASVEPIRWLDDAGRQANSSRFVKATLDHSISSLLDQHGSLQSVGEALIAGDPEIDMDNTGRALKDTARVFVDKQGGIVRNVRFWEVIKNPDGSERERRPRQLAEQNVSTDTPLKWSGVFVPKAVAVKKFVFTGKAQLQHVNGLTYDFLYAMAKDLEERNSLMLLGSGAKSNQPLVLRRGGTPYRGFLEGRTDGDKYCLLLHFSNLELKSVPASAEADTGTSTTKKTAAQSPSSKASPTDSPETQQDVSDESPSPRKKKKPTKKATKRTTKSPDSELEVAIPTKKVAKKKAVKKKSITKKVSDSGVGAVEEADATPKATKKRPAKSPVKKKAAKKKAPKQKADPGE